MLGYRPTLVRRAALALQVFRQGLPTKSAPFLWPDFSAGRPIWHIIDLQSYINEGFNLNALVYECIMYKVRAMTAAPLRAYQGDEDNPDPLPPQHELSKLIHRPNDHQSWAEFHGQNIVYKNLAGNYYVFLDRPARTKMPTAMYSMRPDRVYLIPDKEKKYGKAGLMGYMYVPEGKSWRDGIPLLPSNVIHVKFPNPGDSYEGMGEGLSPMSPLARSADVDNQITKYLKMFFDKGAMQSGALSFEVPMTPEKIANLREQYGETYGGVDNWYKPIVLDQGGKYQRMSLTFDEMGFQGLDERNESRILGPFGVPPVLVGSRIGLENSPWSNIGEARRIFWEDTMLPESRLDEVEYDYFLGGKGVFLRFDYSDVPALRKDIGAQVEAAYKLWTMGVPRDTALATVGMDVEQVPGGDVSYMPMNMLPAGKKEAEIVEEAVEEPKSSQRKDRLWTRHDSISLVWERSFRDKARELFEADKRKLLSLMRSRQKAAKEAKATIDWQGIYQDWMAYLDEAGTEWRSAFVPLIKGLILDQGEALNLEFGMVFDVANLFAQDWFNTYTFAFAKDVVATTGAALEVMFKTALAEGWSVPIMQKRLELLFKQWMTGDVTPEEFTWFEERMPKYRTEMIARTETIRASNKGADALYTGWGVEWKEWVAGLDERTCEFCLALDGKRWPSGAVVGYGDVQFNKGAVWNLEVEDPETKQMKTHTIKLDYETVTGPPLHPSCRCSLVPWKEEWEGME